MNLERQETLFSILNIITKQAVFLSWEKYTTR